MTDQSVTKNGLVVLCDVNRINVLCILNTQFCEIAPLGSKMNNTRQWKWYYIYIFTLELIPSHSTNTANVNAQ